MREPPRARFRRRGIWRSDEICREEIEEDRVRGARDDDEWKLEMDASNNGGGMKGQQTPTQQHLTYPDHFCACKGFAWDVISRDEKLMCKHMLAAALAESVGGCDEVGDGRRRVGEFVD